MAVELDFRAVRGVVAHRNQVANACRRKRMAESAARDLRGRAVLELHPELVSAGGRHPALDRGGVDLLFEHQRLGLRSVTAQVVLVGRVPPPLPVRPRSMRWEA